MCQMRINETFHQRIMCTPVHIVIALSAALLQFFSSFILKREKLKFTWMNLILKCFQIIPFHVRPNQSRKWIFSVFWLFCYAFAVVNTAHHSRWHFDWIRHTKCSVCVRRKCQEVCVFFIDSCNLCIVPPHSGIYLVHRLFQFINLTKIVQLWRCGRTAISRWVFNWKKMVNISTLDLR